MIDFLEKGKTNNRQYHVSKWRQLMHEIKLKLQRKLRAGVLLLQDYAPIHTSWVAVIGATIGSFEFSVQSSNSSDFALSDFLFLKLKSHPCGCHFGDNKEVICTLEEFLEDPNATFICNGIAILEHHWDSALMSRGTVLKKKWKKCPVSLTPSEWALELFEWPLYIFSYPSTRAGCDTRSILSGV